MFQACRPAGRLFLFGADGGNDDLRCTGLGA
jgi:hypothetical protein